MHLSALPSICQSVHLFIHSVVPSLHPFLLSFFPLYHLPSFSHHSFIPSLFHIFPPSLLFLSLHTSFTPTLFSSFTPSLLPTFPTLCPSSPFFSYLLLSLFLPSFFHLFCHFIILFSTFFSLSLIPCYASIHMFFKITLAVPLPHRASLNIDVALLSIINKINIIIYCFDHFRK